MRLTLALGLMAMLASLGFANSASAVVNRCYWSIAASCEQSTTGSYGGIAAGATKTSGWGAGPLGLVQVFMNNYTSGTNKQQVLFRESTDAPITSWTAATQLFYRNYTINDSVWFRCDNESGGAVNVQCGAVIVGNSYYYNR